MTLSGSTKRSRKEASGSARSRAARSGAMPGSLAQACATAPAPLYLSAMPSFDVVSKLDLAEVDNALQGIRREIGTRFDFKDSKCSVERQEGVLTILADDDLKLKQMHELLKVHLTR